jgi:hypothetical protein
MSLIKRRDAEIAKIRAEKIGEVVDLRNATDTKLFEALENGIADVTNNKTIPSPLIAHAIKVARVAIETRVEQYRGRVLPIDIARELIPLARKLEEILSWDDKDGYWVWSDTDGATRARFKEDDGVVSAVA